jgi:hypothetical protein
MASKKGKKAKKAESAPRSSEHVDESIEQEKAQASSEQDDADGQAEPPVEKASPAPKQAAKKGAEAPSKAAGVLALFDHPNTTLVAATRARDHGFERWDVYTPFPVHGMDDAMGLGRSPVPWITFVMGVVGFCAAIIIQFGTMVYSWPMNYGGKPFAAWPSFVPITFEMTVLAAGVSTAIGSLFLGGVLRPRKRIAHRHVTSHRFAIFVEASDPKYDEQGTVSLFRKAGAMDVRVVKEGE